MADRVDDLDALIDLLPQLEVTFNGQPIYTVKFEPKHLMIGDTIQLEGNAPGQIAAMIYEVIERGALLA